MSNFTPLVHFDIEFDGDNISMDLHRLKKACMIKIAPHLPEEIGEDGKVKMEFADEMQLLNILDELLPNNVDNFTGLKTADGIPITLDAMIKEGYFIPLASNILGKLVSITNPTKGEKDNPKDGGESGNLKGQETEASTE